MNTILLREDGSVKCMNGRKVIFDGMMEGMMRHEDGIEGFVRVLKKILHDAELVRAKNE